MDSFFSTLQMRILGALTLLMVIIALGSYASLNFEKAHHVNPNPPTISLVGEAEIQAVPDIGQFSFSVMAEAEDADTAQRESGEAINEILAYLAEQGVEEKDIKTTNYNLYPNYSWIEPVCPVGSQFCPGGERVQDGFTVSQSVSVKVRDTDQAGDLIAGVGSRGATNISGLTFTIDDMTTLEEQARAEAITDAQEQAVVLAEQLGVAIVRLAYFNENGGNYYGGMYETRAMAADMDMEESFSGPETPTGEQTIRSSVTLTYEVR